jgi:ABC-type sulfate transport system permease component
MKTKSLNAKNLYFVIGLVLIAFTFALNERIIVGLFPSYKLSFSAELKYAVFGLDVVFALALAFMLVRHQPKAKIALDAAVGLGFALLMLAGIELAFFYLNSRNARQLENVVFEFANGSEQADVQFDGEHAQAFF